MIHISAGGVVIGNGSKIVVVNQNGDSWSLPKGHVDEGEDKIDTAKREIYEESGITELELISELGSYQRPTIGRGGMGEDLENIKQITFFLFKTDQKDLEPVDPHNPEARWLEIDEAIDILHHQKDKQFLAEHQKSIELAIASL